MNLEVLDNLITEGENLTNSITFVPADADTYRNYSIYRVIEQERYQDWQSSSQRFVKTYHSSDLDEIREAVRIISPENHRKILGVLRAIKLLPNEPEKLRTDKKVATNNINITNTQSVSQQLTLNLFLDAIKDELTGKDLKALKEILKDFEKEPEKTKSKLIEKIKGFGSDVLSNIVANIITNPTIYSDF